MFAEEKSKFAKTVTFIVPQHSTLSTDLVVSCVPKSYKCFTAVIKKETEHYRSGLYFNGTISVPKLEQETSYSCRVCDFSPSPQANS